MTVTADRRTSPALTRPALREGRVLVLVAIVLSALNLRTAVTAFTPLAERIGDDIGYSTGIVGVFGMIPTAMFALAGLLTPILVRRLGPERTVLAAMLAAGAGQVIRAVVPETVELLGFSALALAGMGVGNVVIPPLVKRYFSDRLAVLSSVYITMVQLGTVVPALVAVPVAQAHGWRVSLGMWALLAFVAVLPWLGVLRRRRGRDLVDRTALDAVPAPGPGTRPDAALAAGANAELAAGANAELAPGTNAELAPGTNAELAPVTPPVGAVWRSPVAWGMAGMFGMTSLTTYAMFTWLPKIFTDAGAGAAFGGSMVGIFALVGLLSALTAPPLAARMRNPFVLVIGCVACYFASFAGLLLAPMAAPLVWVLLLGLGPSTFPLALTLINLRSRTQAGSAALSGFTQGVGYTVACVGPLLFGVLHGITGGWVAPFALLAAVQVVLLVAGWQACKPRLLEDTLHVVAAR
ncbi:MFS transporter [Nocardia sp. alder85J]|uniref:MFS transporter n=1 Tax=Nocardia sp. alder85J TaxID=2862949 RepID=UPI001CD740BA|nr:MFS transporter [Nocardia sp. alder85J]MCX4092250.1 MFS transporter [Nocardia sp. alder85J]